MMNVNSRVLEVVIRVYAHLNKDSVQDAINLLN
jgi:hypothetical protein